MLGISTLRLRSTAAPEDVGGHIGYVVTPSERRKGYGTPLCALTLDAARRQGCSQVLIMCGVANRASARVIEKNGGVLDSAGYSPRRGAEVARYRVAL